MSSYQVIARKYRPQRFSEVVGQEHVTQTLANAISQKRIAHAYLFVGPRGTGKTTIARIFAKCLNCTNGPAADFPDEDPKAREITEGRSLDVIEIDGASNRGIEDIRDLREMVKYAPASGRYKIYIIDEVHMLTKEAFNALLKTLEEPPEHVKFMFATTEPEKVLPTILSRCQRFDLRRIPASLIVKHLADISRRENVQIDDAALCAVARGAEGGMRDAESTLDQLISFCGSKIQEGDVLSMFGLAARAQLLALATAVLEGRADAALRELGDLAHNGKDLSRLLSDLLAHFRNLMIYQVSKGDLSLIDASEAEAAMLGEQAKQAPLDAVTRVMEVLAEAEGRLRDAASKKIFLEITMLKAIEARSALSIDAVLRKLNELRGSGPGAGSSGSGHGSGGLAPAPRLAAAPAAPASQVAQAAEPSAGRVPASAAPTPPAPAPAAAEPPILREAAAPEAGGAPPAAESALPAAAAVALEASLEALWSELVEAVGRVSSFLKTYLLDSHPVSLDKKCFTLGYDPVFSDHIGLVDIPRNRTVIETKLRELGHPVVVKIVKAEAPAGRVRSAPEPSAPAQPRPTAGPDGPRQGQPARSAAPAAAPVMLSKEDFKNDPLIRKALEIFKGTIVEVRA